MEDLDKQFNDIANVENAEWTDKVKEILGSYPPSLNYPADCKKAIILFTWRINQLKRDAVRQANVDSSKVNFCDTHNVNGVGPSGMSSYSSGDSLIAGSKAKEAGLTEGSRFGSLGKRGKQEAYSIALQILHDIVEQWTDQKTAENDLKERIVSLREAMDRAVGEGQWNEVAHLMPTFRNLISQLKQVRPDLVSKKASSI